MIETRRSPGHCVLMFHRIADGAKRDHDLSWEGFRRLMNMIDRIQLPVTASLDPPCGKDAGVVLTFDDGTIDHLAAGREIANRGMAAVFFVPAAVIGRPGYLAAEDLHELIALGHVIGGHGLTHSSLTRLSADDLDREISGSRRGLETVLNAPIRYFAPPGGSSNPQLVPALTRHGFTGSRSTRWGVYRGASERWDIPCVPVADATMRLGWVERSVRASRIPFTMRGLYVLKSAVPETIRNPVRGSIRRRVTAPDLG